MRKFIFILFIAVALSACVTTGSNYPSPHDETYQEAVTNWTSHEDVALWLKQNFRFSSSRKGSKRFRHPENLYRIKSGYSLDAAVFAEVALNEVNKEYKASLIFIKNAAAGSPHWVTGFYIDGELYVMDYGAGQNWSSMHGTHGPYISLAEYYHFLEMLHVPNFRVKSVSWRDLPDSFTRD